MNLNEVVRRVSTFIVNNPNERDCWQKAPAISGLLAWQDPEFMPTAKKWIDRAVATQKSDGNLSYGDWHTSSGGHIRTFTVLASETAAMGAPMMELHAQAPDPVYLESAARQYQALLDAPRTSEGGIWARGEGPELWIDFTYLMCPFMARYGVATDSQQPIDEAFHQLKVHAGRLIDDRAKLARHAWCEKPNFFPQSTFWARGNAWFLAACAELLDIAPDHPEAGYVREIFAEVLDAMAAYQDASGYFYHVLDEPNSNLEASATVMFAYAAARANQQGIRLASYSPEELHQKALKAFVVVAGSVEESGRVPGVAAVPGGPGVPFSWTLFAQGFFLLAAYQLQSSLSEMEL